MNPLFSKFNPVSWVKEKIRRKLFCIEEQIIMANRNFTELKTRFNAMKGAKIKLVFICHRPALWIHLKTFCDACLQDEAFDVTILAIPSRKSLSSHDIRDEVYETEGAESYFKDYPCKVINGYDYEHHLWYDLKSEKPDYVFYQVPYNIIRPEQYSSATVSSYAKICYIHYGLSMLKRSVPSMYMQTFFCHVSFLFAETPWHEKHYKTEFRKQNSALPLPSICLTGTPAFDQTEVFSGTDSPLWKHECKDHFLRILWTPRWDDSENNCNFSKYKDFLPELAEKEHYDLVFRPHPFAFKNYVAEGILSAHELEKLKKRFMESPNCMIDQNSDSLQTIYSSDVLVTDPGGLLINYFFSGKPIIYCKKSNSCLNDFYIRLLEDGTYVAHDKNELCDFLAMLRSGRDPLKGKRAFLKKEMFCIPEYGAGKLMKRIIKDDFYQ